MNTRTILTGARIVDPSSTLDTTGPTTVVIDGDRIASVGAAVTPSAHDDVIDLNGRALVAGFVDAHVHLLATGEAVGSVPLTDAANLTEIQRRLREARSRLEPGATVLRGGGWLFSAVDGEPTAAMIDAAVSDIPVLLDANDLHSMWVNTAALRAMGIDASTTDPPGGRISRLPSGEPAGMLYERAVHEIARVYLQRITSDDHRRDSAERGLAAFTAAGVTSVVDMAMHERAWDALSALAARDGGRLPLRVAAHWSVNDAGNDADNLAQVRRAAEVRTHSTDWLGVIGVKLVLDGVIDACTAAMAQPYARGGSGELLWDVERLRTVAVAADAAGLRLAIHAIGDRASSVALDIIEDVIATNPPWDRRPRIEHLEVVADETPARLASLGVTASMQPVHADPAIQENWRAQLGDDRIEGGFAWPLFTAAGALLAFGTDAPTAPHEALPNLYIATTRRSALDPELPANLPHFALPLDAALRHATSDAAASFAADGRVGRVAPGYLADLTVLERHPAEPDGLLGNAVALTISGGRVVFRRDG